MKDFILKNKQFLILFCPAALFYILFNYLPITSWIQDETVYLILKMILALGLSFYVIFFKKKWEMEIPVPKKSISYFYLLALLFPCFLNLSYHYLEPNNVQKEFEYVLLLDLLSDLCCSIIEDVTFVDLAVYFYINNLKCAHKKFMSALLASLIFMLLNCYQFISNNYQITIIRLCWVFMLTFECGYLAIFFDSFLIPVFFHYVFNAVNYVIFDALYTITFSPTYIVFNIALLFMTSFYLTALWHLSESKMRIDNDPTESAI